MGDARGAVPSRIMRTPIVAGSRVLATRWGNHPACTEVPFGFVPEFHSLPPGIQIYGERVCACATLCHATTRVCPLVFPCPRCLLLCLTLRQTVLWRQQALEDRGYSTTPGGAAQCPRTPTMRMIGPFRANGPRGSSAGETLCHLLFQSVSEGEAVPGPCVPGCIRRCAGEGRPASAPGHAAHWPCRDRTDIRAPTLEHAFPGRRAS